MDQPVPVLPSVWRGWFDQPQKYCSWIRPGLFDEIVAGPPVTTVMGGCEFRTKEGSHLHIYWTAPYSPYLYDLLAFVEPTRIAGLEGRLFDLATHQKVRPGSCQVEMDTRSFTHPVAAHWNDGKELDREKSCATVKRVMEILLKAVVPSAGGTPWPGPQVPSPDTLKEMSACDVVTDVATMSAGIRVGMGKHTSGTHPLGTTCRAEKNGAVAETLLTTGPQQGLAEVKPAPAARVTPMRLGSLSARMEVLGPTCAVAVELVPGRLLRTQYSNKKSHRGSCQYARLLAAEAVMDLLERTP